MGGGPDVLSNRWLLRTTGYCRSGNTFLNYVIRAFYYPNETVNLNWHTVAKLKARERVLVPFRNPLDCITSWHLYPSSYPLEADIKYYLRFYSAVLETPNAVLMDFDLFTKDLTYTHKKVFDVFGISSDINMTIEQVKATMLADGKTINLPRDDKAESTKIQEQLQTTQDYAKCVELYERLLAYPQHSNIGSRA